MAKSGAEGFRREIRIAAGLLHPHIVPLFDSGEAAGLPYYVMPCIEGESLRARLDRDGALTIRDAVRIAREIASALAHAHQHGVLHRDIKPDNVLLSGRSGGRSGTPSFHAMVTDFGIARSIAPSGSASLRPSRMVAGSPPYMSPEQAAGHVTADWRSDVYSLGCVLYEMLAGRQPFTGTTSDEILLKHAVEQPTALRQFRPNVPRWLERVVETALAKKPSERFESAAAFAAALERRVRSASSPTALAGAVSAWSRVPMAAAGALVAAVIGATRWIWH
jgi:serine/threonine-protein kinase